VVCIAGGAGASAHCCDPSLNAPCHPNGDGTYQYCCTGGDREACCPDTQTCKAPSDCCGANAQFNATANVCCQPGETVCGDQCCDGPCDATGTACCSQDQTCGDVCCADDQTCCNGACQAGGSCEQCPPNTFACMDGDTLLGCCTTGLNQCCKVDHNSPCITNDDICCPSGQGHCDDGCCVYGACQNSYVNGQPFATCCPQDREACAGACCDAGKTCVDETSADAHCA
ncbi:MAG TPA: hypothetical protein VFL82_10495, partial [Thermomicrobiales bacterium]|nr:hypothetical protein [Thermomicrobiales bacterium]